MLLEKIRQIEAEDNWDAKARAQDIRCPWCGCLICYADRDVYYEHGGCGLCYHTINKDD